MCDAMRPRLRRNAAMPQCRNAAVHEAEVTDALAFIEASRNP